MWWIIIIDEPAYMLILTTLSELARNNIRRSISHRRAYNKLIADILWEMRTKILDFYFGE